MRTKNGFVLTSALGCWMSIDAASQPLHQSTPFVAQIEKRFKKSIDDPNPSIQHVTYARKSDGSFVHIFDSESPDRKQSGSMKEIHDARKSLNTILEPFSKSVISHQYSPREYQEIIGALEYENCDGSQTILAGTKVVDGRSRTKFGRQAMHEVERIPLKANPDSQMEWIHERYVVPELRCFSMHTIDRRSDGAVTEEEVVSFQEGEPPAAYFSVPLDYVERSPRELNEAYAKKFGKGQEFWPERMVVGMERRYQRLKADSKIRENAK